jgi:large subunit ribosomal protein L25
MSDQISLVVDARDTYGKAVKRLRERGIVPGVIHDHGHDSVHVQAEYQALHKAYVTAGKHRPVQLTAGTKKYTAIIKTVTFDPRYHAISHVVFGAVKANEKVEAEIPVHPTYNEGNDASPAERAGLIVLAQLDVIQVKALSKDLPDELTYDAEKLVSVGDQVTVADLVVPSGVEVETEENHVIATVFEPSALAAANDDAGGTAAAGDEGEVAAEHVGENEAVDPNRKDEIRPGGREEKEDKQQGRSPEKE